MTSETDLAVGDAREVMHRVRGREPDMIVRRPRRMRRTSLAKRVARIAVADAAILVAAVVIGLIGPLGMFGALAVMALLIAATVTLAIWPGEPAPVAAERLREVEVRALPSQTARWLDAQRPALPAPAIQVTDRIGRRLDELDRQLATLDPASPAAGEVRKLVGEQLPDFVRDYARVPAHLRGLERNGKTPDRQLVEGLELIDREIGEMSAHLAQGDLDTLATRGRFLEIKYRDGVE